MDAFAAFLRDAAGRAQSGDPIELSIRDLLHRWGAKRRGYWVVWSIERELEAAGLRTEPPFQNGWIDEWVSLVPIESGKEGPQPGGEAGTDADDPGSDVVESDEVGLRIGSLQSAGGGVCSVTPQNKLVTAQSLMMRRDYSQLAVMSGERDLVGAISWESIAHARIADPDADLTASIIQARVLERRDDLITHIPMIIDRGFVFVRDERDRRITGIVTTADLSAEFATLAGPFFLVGEAERRLRRAVDRRFDPDELAAVRDSADSKREVKSAEDLTIGEHQRLLEDPDNWARMGWAVDRKIFLDALDTVRSLRNEVMHFSPDPIEPERLGELRNFIKWLSMLEQD